MKNTPQTAIFDAVIDAWNNRKENPFEARELILSSSGRLIEAVSAYLGKNIKRWAETWRTPHEKFLIKFYSKKNPPNEKYYTKKLRGRKIDKDTRKFLKEQRKELKKQKAHQKLDAKLSKYKKQKEVLRIAAYREKQKLVKTKDLRKYKTKQGKIRALKRNVQQNRKIIKITRQIKASEQRYKKLDSAINYFAGERWFELQRARFLKGQISQEKFEDMLLKKYG